MRRKIVICLFFFIFCSLAHAEYAPGEIMVKFKPGIMVIPKTMGVVGVGLAAVKAASVKALNAKHEVAKVRQVYSGVLRLRPDRTDLEDDYVLIFPESKDVEKIAEEYQKDPNVESASPVGIVKAFETNPNDPYFANGNQYGLTNMKCPQAWDRTTGTNETIIAVLDTGVNYAHEDLSAKVDVANGWDCVNDDNDPMDDHSDVHGTTVAGVIAASTNNGKGVAGVDWNATILPVKVLDSDGEGKISDILEGLEWAMAKNANIVNMSFGQRGADPNLRSKCLDAYNAGLVLVAAAGNDNVEIPSIPASYSFVLAVAAVDVNDKLSNWGLQGSNYGSWIDICAPGTNIYTTSSNTSNYATTSGTSLACPFVSGLAGLIRSDNLTRTNRQIMNIIKTTAEDIDGLNPSYAGKLGHGRVNAYDALSGLIADISSPASGAYIRGQIDISGTAGGWVFGSYILDLLSNEVFVATIESKAASVESGVLGSWDTAGLNGEHKIRLRSFSASGANTIEASLTVYVDNTTPEAGITSPASGATIGGQALIIGTASDQYLNKYLLEYGEGSSPASFEQIIEGWTSVAGGVLGTWETTGLSGSYIIRLTVYGKVGDSVTTSVVVTVQNATDPTKTAQQQTGLPLTYAVPNPFDRTVTAEIQFGYTLAGNFATRIYLFDLTGNLAWQKSYSAGADGGKAGVNTPTWDGKDLFGAEVANGIYLYQVVADQAVIAKGKIIILK
ncbi:hypothetical protein A3F86_03370 [candidate division WOR-1 bacterium RIFCSPLOWO2_12_FULL_45_9]|uniref:Uncharacterized protein n=1 Tax=candidate division WOR-1 bacterium RIFCSPLOWO2_12_FULL_45_9 TaxID=1802568 RepID=A0A1F4RJS8_UNCSA|nr:MAG: hypothetical protein A3F86_03370 [candidate division WOR-1 bacterium RIFCSPLOWO2_12_FULL_45_9]